MRERPIVRPCRLKATHDVVRRGGVPIRAARVHHHPPQLTRLSDRRFGESALHQGMVGVHDRAVQVGPTMAITLPDHLGPNRPKLFGLHSHKHSITPPFMAVRNSFYCSRLARCSPPASPPAPFPWHREVALQADRSLARLGPP